MSAANAKSRILGLNAIRAACALLVVVHHVEPPALIQAHHLSAFYRVLTNGPAAVIIFFVISGFCIHYGNVGRSLDVRAFYLRRYVRITIPLVAAVAWAVTAGINYSPFDGWITWSLVCEEVYYLIYPLIQARVLPRWGLARTTGTAFVLGYAALAMVYSVLRTPNLVLQLSAKTIGYYPVWLLGCQLAELFRRGGLTAAVPFSSWPPLFMRLMMIGGMAIVGLTNWRWGVPDVYGMPLFGLLGFYWIYNECARLQTASC